MVLFVCFSSCSGITTASAKCLYVANPLTSRLFRGERTCSRLLETSARLLQTSVAPGEHADNVVHIESPDGAAIDVNTTWLRENCRCEQCYNAATRQRSVLAHRLAASSLRPASVANDGNRLSVIWQDGHRSQYDVAWLRSVVPPAPVDRIIKVRMDTLV